MAQVEVFINDVSYTITCDDGQENRLRELAQYLDDHVQNLSQQVGNVPDSRLMLLAGLMVTDELLDARNSLINIQDQTGVTSTDGAAKILSDAADKVRTLTDRVESV